MSHKFPKREPEHHEMKHIGDGEFFCPICYRQVKFNGDKLEVMKDSRGRPLEGDIFARHSGTTVPGLTMDMQTEQDDGLDPDIWEYWD